MSNHRPTSARAATPNPFEAGRRKLPSPFAAPPPSGHRASVDLSGIDKEKLTYGIVASGPPVDATEVETQERALEVMVMWGQTVLHVDHLTPARTFTLGDADAEVDVEGYPPVDYLMSSEVLGLARLPLCVVQGDVVHVTVPEGAAGEVVIGETTTRIASIQLQPSTEVPGASQYTLPEGATARVHWKGFTFVVKGVAAGKKLAKGFSMDWAPLAYLAAVAAIVVAVMTAMYFTPPLVSGLANDAVDPNTRLAQIVIEANELDPPPEDTTLSSDNGGDAAGEPHAGEEGQMGDEAASQTENHVAQRGDANPDDVQLANRPSAEDVATTGAIGVLAAVAQSFAPISSPYGADQAVGADEITALGALTGTAPGSNFGLGGLGLHGTGRHGGGFEQGRIGVGGLSRIGHGTCRTEMCSRGPGNGWGEPGGWNRPNPNPPRITGTPRVTGSLSADAIRRVVRRHLAEVRHCYEQGLLSQPDLAGTTSIRWIIGMSGAVQASTVAGSVGSSRVDSCVAGAVRRWTFPAPEGGIVGVTYPFTMRQG